MSFLQRLTKGLNSSVRGKRPLFLFNTLGKEKREFAMPRGAHTVRMYNCGPTVYDVSHIGNLRSYLFADLIRRTLEYNGFQVKQVINITDFGHLSSDADLGNDKMSMALKREGMPLSVENMLALGEKYASLFIEDLKKMNIDTSRIEFPRASQFIAAEIAMVQTLEEKGYAYRGTEGVYFDTSRFPEYGTLGNIDIAGLKEGARVVVSDEKRRPTDFLLWKSDENLGWDSPWGKGFPGWHIECSAMINSTLGKQIDIHTGGIDLMPTHHNNEIAQSECAVGKKPLSRFWLHHEFLNLKDERIAKSLGNAVNLSTLVEKGFHPLAYRYFLLGAHYRSPLNFTWEALEASQNALVRLLALRLSISDAPSEIPKGWQQKFHERVNDDLDTPGALAVLWEMTKDEKLSPAALLAALIDFDNVLGLGLAEPDADQKKLVASQLRTEISVAELPAEVRALVEEREAAREKRDWQTADSLRIKIEETVHVEDSATGVKIFKK